MKIIRILKREEDVDQKSYILWTFPGILSVLFLMFLDSDAGDRFMSKYLVNVSVTGLIVFIVFNILLLLFVIFLSGRRFVLFNQSGYLAFLMVFLLGYLIIWMYLAFRKDLYYLEESQKNHGRSTRYNLDV